MGALDGKVAIVTGAGSGIGRASAKRFAAEGAKLVIGDKTDAVFETAKTITEAGGTVTAVQIDAGNEADVAKLVDVAKSSYGGLDVAFANAGISGGMDGIFDAKAEDFAEILRVNLIGPWLMIKHAGKLMLDQGRGGSIICTASVAGIRSGAGGAHYSASKAGVINLIKTSAQQLSSTGIRVNAIAPGWVETPILDHLPDKLRDGMTDMVPLGRIGQPEEIAALALFLASDESSYVIGQVISPNGGGYA